MRVALTCLSPDIECQVAGHNVKCMRPAAETRILMIQFTFYCAGCFMLHDSIMISSWFFLLLFALIVFY